MSSLLTLRDMTKECMQTLVHSITRSSRPAPEGTLPSATGWGLYLLKPDHTHAGPYGTGAAVVALSILSPKEHESLIREGQQWLIEAYAEYDRDKSTHDDLYFTPRASYSLAALAHNAPLGADDLIARLIDLLSDQQHSSSGSWGSDEAGEVRLEGTWPLIHTCCAVHSLLAYGQNDKASQMVEKARPWIAKALAKDLESVSSVQFRDDLKLALVALAAKTLLEYPSSMQKGEMASVDIAVELFLEILERRRALFFAQALYDDAVTKEPFTLHATLLMLLCIAQRRPDDLFQGGCRHVLEEIVSNIKTCGALCYPSSSLRWTHALPDSARLLRDVHEVVEDRWMSDVDRRITSVSEAVAKIADRLDEVDALLQRDGGQQSNADLSQRIRTVLKEQRQQRHRHLMEILRRAGLVVIVLAIGVIVFAGIVDYLFPSVFRGANPLVTGMLALIGVLVIAFVGNAIHRRVDRPDSTFERWVARTLRRDRHQS